MRGDNGRFIKFFSDNKDALLATRVILTFLASIVSLYFSVRNNKAVHYVNAIIKSRIEWIQKVRKLIADFIQCFYMFRPN